MPVLKNKKDLRHPTTQTQKFALEALADVLDLPLQHRPHTFEVSSSNHAPMET